MRSLSIVLAAVSGLALGWSGAALAQSAPPGPPQPPADMTPPPANPMPEGWGPHGKKLHYLMIFVNAKPGQDADLNRWYNEIHTPMMIERGDFVWAQRFMIDPEQFDGVGNAELKKRRYMVIFAFESNDVKATAAEANARMTSPRNVGSPAMDYKSLSLMTYQALGPVITQEQAQQMLKVQEAKGVVPKVGQPAPAGSYNPLAGRAAPAPSTSPR
jgi:hypothetical protein